MTNNMQTSYVYSNIEYTSNCDKNVKATCLDTVARSSPRNVLPMVVKQIDVSTTIYRDIFSPFPYNLITSSQAYTPLPHLSRSLTSALPFATIWTLFLFLVHAHVRTCTTAHHAFTATCSEICRKSGTSEPISVTTTLQPPNQNGTYPGNQTPNSWSIRGSVRLKSSVQK